RKTGLLDDRTAPKILEPAEALSERLDQAGHAVNLVEDLVSPERVLPTGDGFDEVERIIERGVGEINVELLAPGRRVFGGDAMVAVELIVLDFVVARLVDDHALFVRFLVAFAPYRRRQNGHLHAHRAGLAQEFDLVD